MPADRIPNGHLTSLMIPYIRCQWADGGPYEYLTGTTGGLPRDWKQLSFALGDRGHEQERMTTFELNVGVPPIR
ncbi:MAG: hypothetical protein ABSD13_19795 [Candidatus Korobacteraceae bacterium]